MASLAYPYVRRCVVAFCDAAFAAVFTSRIAPIAYVLSAPLSELYFYSLASRFIERQQTSQHATCTPFSDEAEAMRFWEIVMHEQPQAIYSMLRNWFLGDESLEMRRDNVLEFLLWSTYNTRIEEASAAQRDAAETLLERMEAVTGHELAPGYERRLRVMSYTLEAWPECRKPLFAYIGIQMARQLLHCFLRCHSFEQRQAGRLLFWCRSAPPSLRRPAPPPPPPIVLMHGVLGLLPYAMLLRELASAHEGAVLAPVFPHCSITLEHICATLRGQTLPHNASELTAAIRTMIAQHAAPGSPPRAAFIAHSLGSAFLAPVLRRAPDLAITAAFIDPICFLLPDGNVLKNFLYASPPHGGLHPASWFHFVQRYLVANEPTVQDCFRTCFWWAQHWLHPSDLPCDALVLLSGKDSVANANHVHAYLRSWQRRARSWADRARSRSRKLEVQLHEQWSHGWLMLHPAEQRSLVRNVIRMTLLNAHNLRHHATSSSGVQRTLSPGSVASPYEALVTPYAPGTPTVDDLRRFAAEAAQQEEHAQVDGPKAKQVCFTLHSEERRVFRRSEEDSIGDTASQVSTSSEEASTHAVQPMTAGA